MAVCETIKGGHMFKIQDRLDKEKEVTPEETAAQKDFKPAPTLEKGDKKTIIGEHIFIEGSIRGDENMLIEGSMKGNIEMGKHNFTLGSSGRLEGNIQAQNVIISGQMTGNIKTQGIVKITKEADFLGEIKAKSISIADGAYFKGAIELDREPHRAKVLPEKSSPVSVLQVASESKSQVGATVK